MLKHLYIKNYALIKELDISPSENLNMITGETGAGKSIMLGAVGLLLGNRVDTKVLFNQDQKCVIEGSFDIKDYALHTFFEEEDLDYNEDCIIRREINPAGKSRGFINDTPVKLETMKTLGVRLIDIHSQNDTQLLRSDEFQVGIIDIFGSTNQDLVLYQGLYHQFKEDLKAFETIKNESEQVTTESDYHLFQYEELKKANFTAGEQEELEEQSKVIEHAEEIKSNLNLSLGLLTDHESSVQNNLSEVVRLIGQLGSYSESLGKLSERMQSLLIELDDIRNEITKEEEKIDFDPRQMDEVKERLSLLYHLQQKHKVSTIEELLTIQEALVQKVDKAENMDMYVEEAKLEMEKSRKRMLDQAQKLSSKRVGVIKDLASNIIGLLKDLGIPEANLLIEHKQVDPSKLGTDKFRFLFSANKGVEPAELEKVASGGEFARLMLCIKYILAEKTSLPTIVFDEIDNGISGEIALKLGTMMEKMAANHQVITISHLPQVAAMGDTHYFVYKELVDKKTLSKVKKLNDEERLSEIAKMLSGDQPSESAYNNARELLSASA